MAFDALIQIDGIDGESSDDKHNGWIEIIQYGMGVKQTISNTASSAGGATAERADFDSFVFSKLIDKSSPLLMLACAAGYNRKNQNWNWFYAVGGYSAWIKGVAKVEQDKSGKRKYRFDYEYKVVDRYNWDIGKQVDIFGVTITDEFMGEFHREGMAKEFNMNGSIKTSIEWDSLNPSSHKVVSSPTGR